MQAAPENFKDLFINDVPFIDVRAEVEFTKGALPCAVNFPILNNDERRQVGTCYKQEGQPAAIELGHKLISGELKKKRIKQWCDFASKHNQAHLYCWRGGMRSNLTQQWMKDAGIEITLIPGGYKALRGYLLSVLEQAHNKNIVRIGGRTGVAKTVLIEALAGGIDLEGLANHRGSSFGRTVAGATSQANFENSLAIENLKHEHRGHNMLWLEDESARIGPLGIPVNIFSAMRRAPMAIIEMDLAFRMQRVLDEYVVDMTAKYMKQDSVHGMANFSTYLQESLFRVRKRLGGERYKQIKEVMDTALTVQLNTGDVGDHMGWIEPMLVNYYDPMYKHQMEISAEKIIFTGSYDEVLQWACEQG